MTRKDYKEIALGLHTFNRKYMMIPEVMKDILDVLIPVFKMDNVKFDEDSFKSMVYKGK